jgi:hypothetical protein
VVHEFWESKVEMWEQNDSVKVGWEGLGPFILRGSLRGLVRSVSASGAHRRPLVGLEGRWRVGEGSRRCLCRPGTEEQAAARFSLI